MTVKELSQLYYLRREIEQDKARLRELEAQRGTEGMQYDGMPHGSGPASSRTEQLAAEIVDLQAIIHARQIQCIHEWSRLERYISSIPDSLTRQIFKCRFVDGMTWAEVAASFGGRPGMDDSTARKICYRYLRAEGQAADGERHVMRQACQGHQGCPTIPESSVL